MIRSLKAALAFAGALTLGIYLGVSPNVSRGASDAILVADPPVGRSEARGKEPPPDPKKKMPGDPCKSSDECQNHHTCAKVGDKSVCQAPERPRLPPHAVT